MWGEARSLWLLTSDYYIPCTFLPELWHEGRAEEEPDMGKHGKEKKKDAGLISKRTFLNRE